MRHKREFIVHESSNIPDQVYTPTVTKKIYQLRNDPRRPLIQSLDRNNRKYEPYRTEEY